MIIRDLRGGLPGRLFLVALLVLAGRSTASAQRASGSILGTATDSSSAVIPGVTVTVTNTGTGISVAGKTDAVGNFLFSNLPPGNYRLTAEMPAFRTFVATGIVLDVDTNRRVDPRLEPGDITQRVEVTSQAPLVDTDDATTGQVIAHKMLTDLPLNGRDYQQLELLSPGAVSSGGAVGGFATTGTVIVANGGRPGKTAFLVDGSDAYDYRSRTTNLVPTLDAIAEFKHQKSQFSAEYGGGGSAVSVVIKSGTNQVHGTLWEFVRNNIFDARNFFSAAKPNPLKRNQFGGNIGGPVVLPRLYDGRNRTFFFVSYETLRQRTAGNSFATLPLPAFRTGDFSQQRNRILDPDTTRRDPANPTRWVRDPFPGNVIPQQRLDSIARFFLPYFPEPNLAGALINNYVQLVPSRASSGQVIARIDHQIGPRDSLFVRYVGDEGSSFTNSALYPALFGAMNRDDISHNGIVNYTHTFGTSTVLEARASASRTNNVTTVPTQGTTDYTAKAGIQGFETMSHINPGFPDFLFTGYAALDGGGGTYSPLYGPRNNFFYAASLTKVRGRHSVKFGTTLRWYQQHASNGAMPRGRFTYSGTYTTNPSATAGTGDAFADYLLGYPFAAMRYMPPGWMYLRFRTYGGYVQDDWKVSSRLTLNLGLRYDVQMPAWAVHNQFGTFVGDVRGGRGAVVVPNQDALDHPTMSAVPKALPVFRHLVMTAAEAGITPRLRNVDRNDFSPRIGFAWRPWGGDDTVFRGGYGIYYLPFDGGRQTAWFGVVPFIVAETSLTNTVPVPTRTTRQFYPAEAAFDPRPTLGANSVDFATSYMQQWSFGIQRRVPYNMVLDTSYVGSKGTKLEMMRQINTPYPGPGDVEARRPYPDFRGISLNEASGASHYHSLQVKLERRWSSGIQMIAGYAYSKLIDNGSYDSSGPTDPYNGSLDRGVADYDVTQRFTFSGTYDLPFFQHAARPVRYILSGWQLSGIATMQSGPLITPIWNGPVPNTGVSAVRPKRIGSGKLDNPTLNRWFDIGAFAAPDPYTYGNSGRNILRGDGRTNLDLAVHKNFAWSERGRVEFRAEAFNALNHPDFGTPNSYVNIPGGGTVRSASAPRILQLALKLHF